MQDDVIVKISQKIRLLRKEKNLTMQGLADASGVTKGLISQIENSHTIPSLPVLINIIQALNINPGNFFKDILPEKAADHVFVFRAPIFEAGKEDRIEGTSPQQIFSKNLMAGGLNVMIHQLQKTERRDRAHIQTPLEYHYLLRGKVEFLIDRISYTLAEGDSILLEKGLNYRLTNLGHSASLLLQIEYISL